MLSIGKSLRLIWLAILPAVLLFFAPLGVEAASLYLSPGQGEYETDQAFSLTVYANSQIEEMNSAGGVIKFNTNLLQVESISKAGSLIDFWAEEPSFDNTAGTVSFEGTMLSRGYQGNSGKILTVVMQTKNSGNTVVNFTDAMVLANDGEGTDITSGAGQATIKILQEETEPKPKPEPKPESPQDDETDEPAEPEEPEADDEAERPNKPDVSSSTHLSNDKWYAKSDVELAWSLPARAEAVSLRLDQNTDSDPGPLSDGLTSLQRYKDLDDGVWYFHLKIRSGSKWSPIAHFPIRVDTSPPKRLKVEADPRESLTISDISLAISADDDLSGVSHFNIAVEDRFDENWPGDEDRFVLTGLPSGKHLISVTAYDQAGNYSSESITVEVKAVPSPVITYQTEILTSGEIYEVRGEAQDAESVLLYLSDDEDGEYTYEAKVTDGRFRLLVDGRLKPGSYNARVVSVDKYGAVSQPVAIAPVVVDRGSIWDVSSWPPGVVIAVLLLLLLNLAASLALLYYVHRIHLIKDNADSEIAQLKKRIAKKSPAALSSAGKKKTKPKKSSKKSSSKKK